ncbi:hypothetical protein B0H13DRAFT_2394661 [Mycena leptocephala]|nr:hypothetical protein B0H13DRAFT_2394661 [Mycena leptocephala]
MDDAFEFEPEFDTGSRFEEDGSASMQYTGTFFPKAKHFVMAGGNFKSVTNIHQVASGPPPGPPPEDLGFPAIQVEIYAVGQSWDARVYDGICQFQKATGFDPYSQEVAIELGYPLLQVSCDQEVLLAYMQQNDAGDWYSDSDGHSYTGKDSASSELGDAFPIQEEDIYSVFVDATEDHPTEENFIPTANESPSPVPEQSLPSGSQCCALKEAELLTPSQSLNITMSVQFVFILTATALSLYDYFCPRS